jgi:hypothetical protein
MNRPNVPPIQRVKKEVVKENKPNKPKFDLSELNAIYEFETRLPGCGELVRFRPFTTGQIKKILAFEGETDPVVISEVLNTLIDEVIIGNVPSIHDIFIKDREYLLMEIRNKTKGHFWENQWECEKCKSQNILKVDLSKLPVTRIDKDTIDYECKILPSLTVTMRFLTVMDEMEIINTIDRTLSDSKKSAELVISMIAGSIDTILLNGNYIKDMSLNDKKYFLEESPTTVYHRLREWLEENKYGTDFNVKAKCHSCDHTLEFNATPENFFF